MCRKGDVSAADASQVLKTLCVFTRLVTEMDNELLSAVMQLLSIWNLSCQTLPPKRKQTAHGERQKEGSARWAFGWANTALHLSLTWKRCCLRCWGTENSTYIWATPRLSLGNKLNWKLPFRLPSQKPELSVYTKIRTFIGHGRH